MIQIGVIGYGYWGPNLVRNFQGSPGCRVSAVCDSSQERLDAARSRYPGLDTYAGIGDLLSSASLDAVAIATPVSTHFGLALAALETGRHVLIEKPIAQTSGQVSRLIEEAARRRLTLMVDHTFAYHPAVGKVCEIVSSAGFGDLYYYDSTRVNLGLFQHDVNVVWDLAVHDLCILDLLAPVPPCAVSATGVNHVPGGVEDIAYLTLFYDGAFIAHIAVNWLAPVKVRQVLIGGSQQMIVYNDLEPSDKVKVYAKGIHVSSGISPESVHSLLVDYRTGDMWSPALDRTEALRNVTLDFLDCIRTGRPPLTGGEAGLRVVRILEAATQSIAERGHPVELASTSSVEPYRRVPATSVRIE